MGFIARLFVEWLRTGLAADLYWGVPGHDTPGNFRKRQPPPQTAKMRFFRHFLWIIAALAFAGWYWLQPHSRAHGTTEASNWLTKETLEQISATRIQTRDQIRTVIQTFRDRLFTEIFPGRTTVPKTLISPRTTPTLTTLGKSFAKNSASGANLGVLL